MTTDEILLNIERRLGGIEAKLDGLMIRDRDHEERLDALRQSLDDCRMDLARLQAKTGLLGAIAGAVAGIGTALGARFGMGG